MLIFNKFCFFSSIIGKKILVYNSQNECSILLDQPIYENLLDAMENDLTTMEIKSAEYKSIIDEMRKLNFLVDSKKNTFNLDIFERKIKTFHELMKSYSTYYLITETLQNNNLWNISDIEFKNCINAIKCHVMENNIKDALIIIKALNNDRLNYYNEIIESIFDGHKYTLQFSISNNYDRELNYCSRNKLNVIESVNNKKKYYSKNEFGSTFSKKKILYDSYKPYQSYLKNKSIQMYINEFNVPTLFLQNINPLEILCPFLSDNCLIIDYGVLIKKCTKLYDPNTIVGFINNGKIKFNKKYNEFFFSAARLHNKCLSCRYIYVCMGQNCECCTSNKVISCMPLGKIINRSLNYTLSHELMRRGNIK